MEVVFSKTFIKEFEDAQQKVNDGEWKIGDLLLEAMPMLPHGGSVPKGSITVKQFIRAVANKFGIPSATLNRNRWVAHSFPKEERVPWISYQMHSRFTSKDNKPVFLEVCSRDDIMVEQAMEILREHLVRADAPKKIAAIMIESRWIAFIQEALTISNMAMSGETSPNAITLRMTTIQSLVPSEKEAKIVIDSPGHRR